MIEPGSQTKAKFSEAGGDPLPLPYHSPDTIAWLILVILLIYLLCTTMALFVWPDRWDELRLYILGASTFLGVIALFALTSYFHNSGRNIRHTPSVRLKFSSVDAKTVMLAVNEDRMTVRPKKKEGRPGDDNPQEEQWTYDNSFKDRSPESWPSKLILLNKDGSFLEAADSRKLFIVEQKAVPFRDWKELGSADRPWSLGRSNVGYVSKTKPICAVAEMITAHPEGHEVLVTENGKEDDPVLGRITARDLLGAFVQTPPRSAKEGPQGMA